MSVVFFILVATLLAYPLFIVLRFGTNNVPKRRINTAARAIHKLRFEGITKSFTVANKKELGGTNSFGGIVISGDSVSQ